ncbi:MAG: glycoside hydrolase family 31 protein, partial [Anaerolineales bacterium]|nr:glycoside hydrolase family 31 protein [Anaerolineales bacterium]
YYGLGERSGPLAKNGQRFRFFNTDALGYNAETSDPLYKHYPFYITFNPTLNIAYGLFYDNFATTIFDMGREHNNYYPPYRYYQADDGDIDYYLIYGPTIENVVEKFTQLNGRMILPPRWSLGYLGSTMSYTDAPDAQEQLKQFVDLCQQHDIPCDLFHLSSGYTAGDDGKRYVFNWNLHRIPNPPQMVNHFHQAGIRLAANIKPSLLTTHPRYQEVTELGGFIQTAASPEPQLVAFWGGLGAHIDFTNPAAYEWWQQRVQESLLAFGIDATWNDNNEYPLEDDDARCHGFGQPLPIGLIRPIQTLLMSHASYHAQRTQRPHERPYLITRAGCPGIQRYAQTWSGDNRTNWHSLRYNIPMGLSMGLSGVANIGHDVGGFAGGKPDPELFVRWVQNGIFHPRFTIHSWNDDGSVNEPWMHPEVLPLVRETIHFRYRLLPYLYSLFFEAAVTGHPIIRPLVYHFSHDPNCHTTSFDFMLGSHLLVASVLEPQATTRPVYLPTATQWCDFYSGTWYEGGQTVTLNAPLERIPLLVRAGGIIPMGQVMRFVGQRPDNLRQLYLFPHPQAGIGRFHLIEDDGISLDYQQGGLTEMQIEMTTTATQITVQLTLITKGYPLPYDEIELILPHGEKRPLVIAGTTLSETTPNGRRHITCPTPL